MKNIFKTALTISIICSLLTFLSCENDLYEEPIRKSNESKLTFEQFKKETNINDFKILRSLAPIMKLVKQLKMNS